TTNGYAYATLTASTTAGIDTIAASVTGLSDTKYVTYTPGQAAQVAVDPGLSSLPADGISTTPVTIRVQDAYGNLVGAGATVSVEASLGMVSPNQGHTNTQSVFTTTLQTERVTGLSAITARSGSAVGYGEVEFVAPNVAAISVQADETSILANGTALTTLRALVVDGSGVPVFGVPVTWEAGTGIGTVTTTLSVTDSMGMALSGFRSGASSTNVSQQVTASASGFEDDVSILMRGVTINVSAQNPMIPADGETTTAVRAHVYETTSHIGLADVSVIFATTLGSIPRTELTNSSGVATVMLQASPSAGLADITAQYGDTLRAITQVSMVSTQGEVITLTPGTSTLLGNGLTSTPLYIYVVDDGGWPSEGEVVTLSIVSGTGMVTPSVVLTNSYGTATATYTSAAVMEDTQTEVEALIERANTTTWISLQGVTLTCAAVPQMIVADGHSTSQIRVQLYQTTTTIAIEGAQVFFGTNLGSVPNQAVTNSSGIATVTLTSGTITGSARVVAGYGVGLIDTVNVSFAESTPTNLNLTANPSIILADNVSTSIISAMITDQGGNPVPDGTQIHFDIPPNSGSLENLRTTTNGVATSILTSSTTPDTVEILAWAGANPSARDSVDIIYTVGPPTVVLLSAQSDTLKADGISVDTIYATVKDAVGHRLPNVEVQFETTIGNIPGSRTTDENGTVRIPFSSPTTGTAQITATAGTGVAYYTVYLVPGCPWSVGMEYNPHSVGVKESGRNETLLITATIKDASNNPVIDGTPVWFDIYSQPITHPDSMGSLSSVDSIPTINGRASVSYSSGFRSGTVRIRARSNGICEGDPYNVSAITTEIIIYSGPPYIEDIYNPDGCGYFNTSHIKVASSPCDLVGWSAVGDSVNITAIVGDKWNNPVPEGTAVYFTTS
ncbi:Ig-like domain-containing protein, partial [bacterium]|nr:Ig-like domain-containing protein [bacterium]